MRTRISYVLRWDEMYPKSLFLNRLLCRLGATGGAANAAGARGPAPLGTFAAKTLSRLALCQPSTVERHRPINPGSRYRCGASTFK